MHNGADLIDGMSAFGAESAAACEVIAVRANLHRSLRAMHALRDFKQPAAAEVGKTPIRRS